MRKVFLFASLLAMSSTVFSASFDCAKASTAIEKSVCSNPTLGQLDEALADNYKFMKASDIGDGARKDLIATQKKWMAERNQCSNATCIEASYRKRMDEVCDYPVLSGVHPGCTDSSDIPANRIETTKSQQIFETTQAKQEAERRAQEMTCCFDQKASFAWKWTTNAVCINSGGETRGYGYRECENKILQEKMDNLRYR